MTSTVIRVENLQKKYLISELGNPSAYGSLREDISKNVRSLFKGSGKNITREFTALNQVSFDLKEGDRLGIIGRNGAGKSTLLKILSRITAPTSGVVKIKGKVSSLLEVGTGFHPELTGRENIFLNGAILGMSKSDINREFDSIVEFSEVSQFLETPVKRYSSGMYMKLAFSVAAHLRSNILIVDEVLAVGDSQFQKKCMDKMEKASSEGKTLLFVSHNLGSVRKVCNLGLVLNKGVSSGLMPVADALQSYQSLRPLGDTSKILSEEMIFKNFRINQQEMDSSIEVFSGDELKLSLEYEAMKPGKDLCISFGIKNLSLDALILFSHNHLENIRHTTQSSGLISATFPSLGLAPGRYELSMQVWSDGRVILDDQKLCDYTVLPVPALGSQSLLSSFPSAIMAETTWSFK